MDVTGLYLADCVGVIVLPISRIIIASAYKEIAMIEDIETEVEGCSDSDGNK